VPTRAEDLASAKRRNGAPPNGDVALVAPAAVRLVDIDDPLDDVVLPPARTGGPYRSLKVVARLDEDPIGCAVVAVDHHGRVARERLARTLRRHLALKLGAALIPHGVDVPDSLLDGVPELPARNRTTTCPHQVSVVVTTCQRPFRLARCLHSILDCDYPDFEVIVVENRPGAPDTRLMLADAFGDDPRVRYVEEPARGLSSARNAGLAWAQGDVVAFTDDDVAVDPAWIRRLAHAFERADDVACVTGLILPGELETDSQLRLEQFMALGKGFSHRTFRLPESWAAYPLLPYTAGVVGSGANTALRADVARQLGGFEPALGTGTPTAGGEDLDLYMRLLREGHAVSYEPGAIVWHAHPDGPADARRQVYRYGVALGATLARQLLAGPDRGQLLRAAPAGVRHLRDPASSKNAGKPAGYPRRLDWLERLGMLTGPVAYLASAGLSALRRSPRPRLRTTAGGQLLYVDRVALPSGRVVDIVEIAPRVPAPIRPHGPRRARPRTPTPDRAALTALFAFFLCAYAVTRLAGLSNAALAAELGALFFGVGTAPLQPSPRIALSVRLGVAGLVGLATVLLIGALMVLGPLWDPVLAALLVVVAACGMHIVALPSALADARLWRSLSAGRPRLVPALTTPSSLCTLAGTSLWLSAALASGQFALGIGGFPAAITPLWHLGVVVVLAGIALAWREEREGYAAFAVGSLVLALTLTPALVYDMPRSQSAGKHVELVRLILASGHLDAGHGIYFAYSGFFAAVAWLCRLAGTSDAIGLATYWPVIIGLVRVAELRFLFGQFIEGRNRRWAAIALVVLVDAIGADYFSPQSVGYVMGLGVFGLVLIRPGTLDHRLAAGLVVTCGCALAVTHQLSPYVIGGVLAILAIAGYARPRWAALGILIPAGLWALLHRDVLASYFSLSSLGRISNFAPPYTPTAPGLSRDPIVGLSSQGLLLGLVVLIAAALVGLARHRRARWPWTYLVCASVGLLLIAVNPYGNEGIFRAALFGIPWLAAIAVHAARRAYPPLASAAWMALTLGLLSTFLVAAFGMDASGVMRRGDLQAVRIFEREAPHDSYLLQVGFGDLPSGAPHVAPGSQTITMTDIDDPDARQALRPRANDLVALTERAERFATNQLGRHAGPLYAIWSPTSSWYAREYGLALPTQSARWLGLLLSSRAWRVVYRSGDTYLLRHTSAPARGGVRP
jgi:GT2 family glycosyltransferase